MIYRTGGAQLYIPGVEVMQPVGGDTPWWMAAGVTPIAAYAPKGAASLAASYVNLANVGVNDAAPGVAPTWDATNGWIFNGTTQYLTTGIVPVATTTHLVRFSNAVLTSTRVVIGVQTSVTARLYIQINNANTQRTYIRGNQSQSSVAGSSVASGVIGVSGAKTYWNGSPDTADIVDSWGTVADGLFIGALNRVGPSPGVVALFDGNIQAVWIASSTLDAAGVLAMYTAMAAL